MCQSYLFIQQLFVFSGETEEDVRQHGPHIAVLEVTDLREPDINGNSTELIVFFVEAETLSGER